MSGNHEGGLKAAQENKRRYGADFYKKLGKLGGRKSVGGGFAALARTDPERLRELSRKGGRGRHGV